MTTKELTTIDWKNRLLNVFKGVSDKLPWVADLSYWYDAQKIKKTLPTCYEGQDGWLRLHHDLGVGIYYDYDIAKYPYLEKYSSVKITQSTEKNRRWTIYKTPKGEICKTEVFNTASCCWSIEEYPLKSMDDLEVFEYIIADRHFKQNYSAFLDKEKIFGKAGLPLTPAPRSPLPAFLVDLAGVMLTSFLLIDAPERMVKIMDMIARSNNSAIDILAAGPAKLIHFCDNLSSEISGGYYEAYMQAYYETQLKKLQSHGKFCVTHLDGTMVGLLHKLAASGFDGIESLTPSPVGDIAIGDLRKSADNPKTILWGGLPGALFSKLYHEDFLRRQLEAVGEFYSRDKRFVLGTADQVPPDTDLERIRMVGNFIRSF